MQSGSLGWRHRETLLYSIHVSKGRRECFTIVARSENFHLWLDRLGQPFAAYIGVLVVAACFILATLLGAYSLAFVAVCYVTFWLITCSFFVIVMPAFLQTVSREL